MNKSIDLNFKKYQEKEQIFNNINGKENHPIFQKKNVKLNFLTLQKRTNTNKKRRNNYV